MDDDGRHLDFYVDAAGRLTFLHSDEASALVAALPGTRSAARASHVELAADGTAWHADLSPIGGPVLGPFSAAERAAAIRAEAEYIQDRLAEGTIDARQIPRPDRDPARPAPGRP